MEDIENHFGTATENLANTGVLVKDVNGRVGTFAREEIHIDEEVPEMAPRTKIKFDENLSKTASDGQIIKMLDRSSLKSPNTVLTNMRNIESGVMMKESRNPDSIPFTEHINVRDDLQ